MHTEPAPTLDEVWRLIKELALQSKETDRKFKETDLQLLFPRYADRTTYGAMAAPMIPENVEVIDGHASLCPSYETELLNDLVRHADEIRDEVYELAKELAHDWDEAKKIGGVFQILDEPVVEHCRPRTNQFPEVVQILAVELFRKEEGDVVWLGEKVQNGKPLIEPNHDDPERPVPNIPMIL